MHNWRALGTTIVTGGILLAVAAPAVAGAQTESRRYRGGISQYPICSVQPSIGGACFLPPSGARWVSVTVRDDGALGTSVGGVVQIVVNEDLYAEVPFCATSSRIALPNGVEGVNVALRPSCNGVGTSGTITARFES